MPVLSEQITEVEPSVSTECSRFTMACCLAMREMPMARVTVTTAGSPSGMAATARATAPSAASAKSAPWAIWSTNTRPTATPAIMARRLPRRSSWRWSGVSPTSEPPSSSATLPISVPMPVEVTTTSARPRTTVVFMKTDECRSPRGESAAANEVASFSTGTDSPVSDDSSIERLAATISRPSAGTRSPASSSTTSPGTRSSVITSTMSPPRRTRTLETSIFSRAARALDALASWK